MFKVENEMPPEIICDIFTKRINNHYNLRHINHFETLFVRTVRNGMESVSYLGPKIWDIENNRHCIFQTILKNR